MARLGINYQDVEDAATALETGGHNPTVDRVRDYLGSGSKSTIAPLLKRWREHNTPERNLPEQLQKAVTALYNTLEADANEKIVAAEIANKSAVDELKQQRDVLEQQALAALERVNELEAAFAKEQEQHQQSLDAVKKLEADAIEMRTALTQKDELLEDRQNALLSQQQHNKHLTESFDHYQQQAALEREQARADHADHQQQWNTRIAEANKQINIYQQKLEQQTLENRQLNQDKIEQATRLSDYETLVTDKQRAIETIQTENNRLTDAVLEKDQTITQLSVIDQTKNEQLDQLRSQLADKEKQSNTQLTQQEQLHRLLQSQQATIHLLQKQQPDNQGPKTTTE